MKTKLLIILAATALTVAGCGKMPVRKTSAGITVEAGDAGSPVGVNIAVVDEKIVAAGLPDPSRSLSGIVASTADTPYDIDNQADTAIYLYTRLAGAGVNLATGVLTFVDSVGTPLFSVDPQAPSCGTLPMLAPGVEVVMAQTDQTLFDYSNDLEADTTLILPEPYIATDGYNVLRLKTSSQPVYVVVFGEDVNLFRHQP